MEINLNTTEKTPPVERVHFITITINSFKGRRDVEVHLFRPDFDEAEMASYDWDKLLGDAIHPEMPADPELSKRVLMEAFTAEERDQVIEYIKDRYADRVSVVNSGPVDLPVPLGLPPLSDLPEGKTIGFIRFDQIPNYPLSFTLRGMYDLAQHEPLVTGDES
ncbi:MAG: hypothetical protein ACOCWR_05995 [Oceanidesulfovibrio sp.]